MASDAGFYISFDVSLNKQLNKPGDEKSILTIVIHLWRSPLCQFARAPAINEYDVIMQVPRHIAIVMTSQCHVRKERT